MKCSIEEHEYLDKNSGFPPLRESLFPNVPPSIVFADLDQEIRPRLPKAVRKYNQWTHNRGMGLPGLPNFRAILERSGFKVIPNRNFAIDLLGQPKVTAGRDHCFRICCPSVRRFVRTSTSTLFKSRKTKQKTTFATGVTMGLAEWIIDDTCLVVF